MSIQNKLLASFVFMAMVILILLSAVLIQKNITISKNQYFQISQAEINSLQPSFLKILLFKDVSEEIDLTQILRNFSYIKAVRLLDTQNQVVYQFLDENIENQQVLFSDIDSVGSDVGEIIEIPVQYQSSEFGLVKIILNPTPLNELYKQNLQLFYWLVPLVLMIAFLMAVYLQRLFSKPILELTEQVKSIAHKKQFNSRTTTKEAYELKSLSDGINTMLEEIRSQTKNLEDYKYALDQSAIVSISDLSGDIMYTNQKFSDISEYSQQELLGENHRILNSGEHSRQFFEDMWKTISQGKIWQGVIKNKKKRGGYYWVNTHIVPLLDVDGKPQTYLSVRFEMTEQKNAEESLHLLNFNLERNLELRTEEIIESNQQLIKAEKLASLGALVSGVAHEVNTPVGVSVTAASYLLEEAELLIKQVEEGTLTRSGLSSSSKQLIESAQIILNNLQRASDLIRSFKQISSDQNIDDYREINALEYLKEVELALAPQFKNRKITLELKCDPNLKLYLNPGNLAQILTNFITNSLKYGFELEDEGVLVFSMRTTTETLILHYSDNGKGMAQKTVDNIFEPFFTTGKAQGGTGLGMHIVYNLIHSLKGTIECSSSLGEGVQFEIVLPNDLVV